jgi:hypothetical protein
MGKSPKINYSTEPVKEESKRAAQIQSSLTATKGGIKGEELDRSQIMSPEEEEKKRKTLFGN